MKRRSFIKKSFGAASVPFLIHGMPVKTFANHLASMMSLNDNNKVVVMIQLAGGNDGLNMLIPIYQYDLYKSYRQNIAIPNSGNRKYILLDEEIPDQQLLGLHPDMADFKTMFDEKLASVVQNVGYENTNLSHFRGRDIWFMGGGSEDYYHSGWMGRYLDGTFEGYPEDYPNDNMPDPLGLEFGYTMSLAFHRSEGIPAGLAITDPDTFYELVTGTGTEPPEWLPDSYRGNELKYLMDLELKSNQYAERIKQVYDSGINSPNVIYPETYPGNTPTQYKENPLSWQFKILARLLSGGIKSKMFILKIDGFDTHADQIIPGDPTYGIHGALMYHLSASVKAFYADLKEQGLDHNVFTFTTSEFGRRVYSNASWGTDHGMAAPVLLFGPMVKEGVTGQAPDLTDLDDGNLKYEFDYRRLYTSILKDWMETPDEIIEQVYWSEFIDNSLDIFKGPDSVNEDSGFAATNGMLVYPNPATEYTFIKTLLSKQGYLELSVFDLKGRKVLPIFEGYRSTGEHRFKANIEMLPPGYYIIRLRSGLKTESKKLVIQ